MRCPGPTFFGPEKLNEFPDFEPCARGVVCFWMAAEALESLSALGTQLSEDERLIQQSVRRFVAERYLPRAGQLFADEAFPRDLIPELAGLGVLGASIQGYGCAGMTPVQYGLVLQELEYGDSGLRSFVSVQGSLAMYAISAFGDERAKRALPAAHGPRRVHRLLRLDRARQRFGSRFDEDARSPRRHRLRFARHQDVDHQRALRRRGRGLGEAR